MIFINPKIDFAFKKIFGSEDSKDILISFLNALIYEEKPELFVEKILELWNDNDKYHKISEYAKEFAKQFDIKAYVEKLVDIYQMQS